MGKSMLDGKKILALDHKVSQLLLVAFISSLCGSIQRIILFLVFIRFCGFLISTHTHVLHKPGN